MQLFNRRTAAIKVVLLASITVDPGPAECAERFRRPTGDERAKLAEQGLSSIVASKVFA